MKRTTTFATVLAILTLAFMAAFTMTISGCNAFDSPTAPRVKAAFDPTVSGLSVKFNNESTGATDYSWDFGDLSPPSNDPSPIHTYPAASSYLVRLRACPSDNFDGPDCDVAEGLVTVTDP